MCSRLNEHGRRATHPAHHGCRQSAGVGRSTFPDDAVARIFKPSRSVMTSGSARTKDWLLTFERRAAPYIEPLMGWTADDDPLTQIELRFPTVESAIAYAKRQGLCYGVQVSSGPGKRQADCVSKGQGTS